MVSVLRSGTCYLPCTHRTACVRSKGDCVPSQTCVVLLAADDSHCARLHFRALDQVPRFILLYPRPVATSASGRSRRCSRIHSTTARGPPQCVTRSSPQVSLLGVRFVAVVFDIYQCVLRCALIRVRIPSAIILQKSLSIYVPAIP